MALLKNLRKLEQTSLRMASSGEDLIEGIAKLYKMSDEDKEHLQEVIRADAFIIQELMTITKAAMRMIEPDLQSAVSKPPLPKTD